MPKRPHFVPINRRALLARMARALKKQGRELRSVRHKGQTSFVLIDARKELLWRLMSTSKSSRVSLVC
jgi:hypothetical protein